MYGLGWWSFFWTIGSSMSLSCSLVCETVFFSLLWTI